MPKVLIATGGTGGHIYPAIALGKYLNNHGINVVFSGRKNSIEEKLIKEEGFKFLQIKAKKFKGVNILNKFFSLLVLTYLIIKGMKIIKEEKVDYLIGTGGYVAAPLVFAAVLKKINTGICEQNSLMGFGNRVLSLFVKNIFLTFENTKMVPCRYKSICTGNFIREEFFENKGEKNNGLLIFGGSQGAIKLNELFCSILDKLKEIENIKIFHITGEKDFQKVKEVYEKYNGILNYEIFPYHSKIYELFKKANIIISRAGATSISEIYYSNKKAILIPYPYAADNHQWYNAIEFCKSGKGVILKENSLTKAKLLKWIKFFINNDFRFTSNYRVLGDFYMGRKMILKKIRGVNV